MGTVFVEIFTVFFTDFCLYYTGHSSALFQFCTASLHNFVNCILFTLANYLLTYLFTLFWYHCNLNPVC